MINDEEKPSQFITGFTRNKLQKTPYLTKEKKVILDKKGDFFLKEGNIETAKRIFFTTKNSNKLNKIGNLYLQRGDYQAAVDSFLKSSQIGDSSKMEQLKQIIKNWLK